jgi:IS605 OrfB family transposase
MIMQLQRTIVLNLEPHAALAETLAEAAKALNLVSAVAFEEGTTSRYALQKLSYKAVRDQTKLIAQMACRVMRSVASAHKSAKSNKRQLKKPAAFEANSVTLEGGVRGREFRLYPDLVNISTVQERLKLLYTCGDFQWAYLQDNWFPQAAKLIRAQRKKGERFELHVMVTKEVEPTEHVSGGVLGVDTGRRYLAVASTGEEACFFPAGHLKPKKEHLIRLRGKLDSKGTHAAKRTRERIARRERRLTADFQHCTAKSLVKMAQDKGCGVIAVERLNGIRQRTGAKGKKARYHHQTWAYAQFLRLLNNKANSAGISVVAVDPANTSRACICCGHTAKENRKKLSFYCQYCHYSLHADLSAARNIRLWAITAGMILSVTGCCQHTLMLWMLTPKPFQMGLRLSSWQAASFSWR